MSHDSMLEFPLVKIKAVDGLDTTLDEEHWEAHIVSGHPEMKNKVGLVADTLQTADAVYWSKRNPETKIYVKEYENVILGVRLIPRIDLRVYVRETGGFVVTAFFATGASLGKRYGLRN